MNRRPKHRRRDARKPSVDARQSIDNYISKLCKAAGLWLFVNRIERRQPLYSIFDKKTGHEVAHCWPRQNWKLAFAKALRLTHEEESEHGE